MSMTGEALLTAFSEFLNDLWSSTTTALGSATTLTDSALQRFGDKANEEAFIRFTEDSGTPGNIYLIRRTSRFLTDTFTFAPAVPQAVESGKDYQVHRWDPEKKFRALDRARILAFPQVAKIVVDETMTSDGESIELPIPSAIRKGPAQVWYESPISPSVSWNILTNPELLTSSGWTATSVTAATYGRQTSDELVPKMEDSCVKLTSGALGSLNQPLGATVAARYAGRRVSFGAWVYSRTAGCTVSITDDAATSTSAAHGGLGWQFLTVSRDVSGTNATTLTPKINPLTNNAVFVERAYFGQVDRIVVPYTNGPLHRNGIHRNDDDANLYLKRPAPRGYQYRLVGRTPVTALGTNTTTQTTNTMEVTEADQDLLLATAARILLTWEGMASGDIDKLFPQIAAAEARFNEMKTDWQRRYPRSGFVSIEGGQ
jgi:hypothetical protein